MPPKKKGKKKGKKKSGKKSGNNFGGSKRVDKINDTSKDHYLIQVKDLEKRIIRMQKRCDELEIMNQQLDSNFSHLSTDSVDISAYLKESVLQKGDEITILSEKLSELQREREVEREMYDQKLVQLENAFHDTKETLTSENMLLSGKLSSMEEFKIQKEDLMEKFSLMEQEIAQIEENNRNILYNMERDAVVDKDKLRKEMLVRVDDVAAEYRKVSNKQMVETTKRTITENVQVNARLQKLSDKTMLLIAENDKLRAEEKHMKRQSGILNDLEKEFMKKCHSNQKSIAFLVDQCRDNDHVLEEYESEENQDTLKALREEHETLKQEMSDFTAQTEYLVRQSHHFKEQVAKEKMDLRETKRFLRKLNRLIQDTRVTVMDAQGLLGGEDDEVTEAEMIEKRQRMLQSFLIMLNSAATLGIGIDPSDIGTQSKLLEYRSSSSKNQSGSATSQSAPSDVIKKVGAFMDEPISQEKLAKFGLNPIESTVKGRNSSELMRGLSATTRLGRRAMPMRSTAVQVGSTATLLRTEKLVDAGQLPTMKDFQTVKGKNETRSVPHNIF